VSKRTKFLLGIGVIAALIIGWQVAAFAVHDEGVFELEGNAVDDAATGDDWENVFDDTSSADETAFVTEVNRNSSIFTGGGSKDQQDIPNWAWKDGAGGLPDKDNLEHSFAASYTTGGKELLYFGADRFDGSGDAAIGFWFFKDKVTLGDIKTGGGFNFNGVHTLGDILVLSNFSNGGTVSTISVYKWNPAVSGNLELLATSNKADCSTLTVTDPDNACAIVNNDQDDDTVPWPFTDKDGNHTYLPGEFFEGGVDLTALGLHDQCFSTALAETRSSTSVTATLKDFTLGSFGECTAGISTSPVKASDGSALPTGGVAPGTAVKDSATVTVSGTTTWSGTLDFFLCKIDETTPGAQQTCLTGGTPVGTQQNVSSTDTQPFYSASVSPTEPGKYCFRGVFTTTTPGVPSPQTDADESECFRVTDSATITTAQKWYPQDTATIALASGGTAPAGTVVFSLYLNGTCSGTPEATFSDNTSPYETTNTTKSYGANQTVSWSAAYTPTDTANAGLAATTTRCETSSITINNNSGPFPAP
jgi:hypothetical protein